MDGAETVIAEDRIRIQDDTDKLEQWTENNQIELSKDKWKSCS